jgi:class 3 adenylate cyclase/predicted ATPase
VQLILQTDFSTFSIGPQGNWVKTLLPAWERFLEEELALRSLPGMPDRYRPLEAQNNALILPMPSGDLLSDWQPHSAADFYAFARALIQEVHELHQAGIAIYALFPQNITYDADLGNISVIELLTARDIQTAAVYTQRPVNIPSGLAYIAPEQTGRTQALPTQASDLFSIGVLLWEILAGSSLFLGTDSLNTIYRLLTFSPIAPMETPWGVHPGIWLILERLLQKDPSRRYASAESLLQDLDRLAGLPLDQPFAHGDNDSEKFTWQKGQFLETGLQKALAFFQGLEQSRQHGILVISGAEGTGKNALTNALNGVLPPAVFTAQADFSESSTSPYAPFAHLLTAYAEYAFALPANTLEQLKKGLADALHTNAILLTDLSPALLKLIPEVRAIAQLPPLESQNRFAFALSSFFQVFHACGISLVATFENGHSGSALSLQILNKVLYETPSGVLLFVIQFDNSSGQNSPLENVQKRWFSPDSDVPAATIALKSWDDSTLQQVLTQQKLETTAIPATARLILAKTGGNPGLVVQLLNRAAQERHLLMDASSRQFVPNLAAIEQYEAAESVAQFQIKLVERMLPELRLFIEVGALLGQKFRCADVFDLLETAAADQPDFLKELQTAGLIQLTGTTDPIATFTTKGFQNTLLQQLSEAEKQTWLKRILAKTSSLSNPQAALQYVLQLPPDQCLEYAAVLEKGIDEAAQTGAFDRAFQCAEHRYLQFTAEDWTHRQQACFDIGLKCLQYVVFNEDIAATDTWIQRLKLQAANKFQLANWAIFTSELYTMQARYQQALLIVLPVLDQFGIHLNTQPGLFSIIRAIVLLDRSMKGKSVEYVKQLPNTHDEETYWKARLLQTISTAVFLSAPQMTPLLMSIQIRLGLRHGLSDATAVSFASYAFKLAAFDQKYDRANEMIELSHQLYECYPNPLSKAVINFLAGTFVHHNSQPLHQVARALLDNYRFSKENGVLGMAYYSASTAVLCDLYSGTPLPEFLQQHASLQRQSEVNGIKTSAQLLRIMLQIAESFSAKTWSDQPLTGSWYVFPATPEAMDQPDNVANSFMLRVLMYWYNALRGQADDATEFLLKYLKNWRAYSPGTVSNPFFRMIMVIQCCKTPERINRTIKKNLQIFIRDLHTLAARNPASNTARYHLAAATWAKYEGQTAAALQHYEQAIEAAVLNRNNIELVLSLDAKAQLLFELGLTLQANTTLKLTYQAAFAWGCFAKCDELKKQYPELIFEDEVFETTAPSSDRLGLDLLSFIRASTSINSEIKLEHLLEKLMPVLSENAGAQRSVLLLPQGKQWLIYAQQRVSKPVDLVRFIASEEFLPLMMLQYALQARQSVALYNAHADRQYGHDAYIQRHQTLSALCLPIVKNQEVKAIIYFENNSAPGTFNQQRLEILQLLSSQVAIALENALLYDEMEARVNLRTQELQEAMRQSEALLLNILPKNVAEELKENGYAAARFYPSASVMFTDFVNFTQVSEKMRPEDLVHELDYCFRQFDAIIGKYSIEKIKTIGDAYLCVSGLPASNPDHAITILQAAKEIRTFINNYRLQRLAAEQTYFDIRIGIDSGPVVAGVVGSSKFAYDIWGNTVNTAARMEQNSEPGAINVSGDTWLLAKDHFQFTYRGKIAAKNKGEVDMYFVG